MVKASFPPHPIPLQKKMKHLVCLDLLESGLFLAQHLEMEADRRRPTSRLEGSTKASLMRATDEVWHTSKSFCISPEITHLLSCQSWLVQRDTCLWTAVTLLQTPTGDLTQALYQLRPPQPASVFFKEWISEFTEPWVVKPQCSTEPFSGEERLQEICLLGLRLPQSFCDRSSFLLNGLSL